MKELSLPVPFNKIIKKEFFSFKISFLEESINIRAEFSNISFIKVWAIITNSNQELFDSK